MSPFTTEAKMAIEPLVISLGSINKQEAESFSDPGRGNVTWKTLISSPQTKTDSPTAGIAICPPKTGHLCSHRHTQAEIYYVTEGKGIVEMMEQSVPFRLNFSLHSRRHEARYKERRP